MIRNLQTILPRTARYLVLTHVEPDFDAIGSVLGLCRSFQQAGYSISGHVETIPFFMQSLPGIETLSTILPENLYDYEVIALDSASRERVYQQDWLDHAKRIVNIDHHQDNPLFGDENLINTNVSSTSEYLYTLLSEAGCPMDESVIIPFYAGILYDTGGFRYSNTKPETLRIASHMMNPYPYAISSLSEQVFSRWNRDSFQALSHALQRIEYWMGERVCFSSIPYSLCCSLPSLAYEGIVDILRLHYAVQMILFIREIEPGVIKGSLRSKPPLTVSQIAKPLGGGGHLRAAGFTTKGISLDELRAKLADMVASYFSEETL
ncbi:bifunctional oligoribonuclease/PAP phosphatase NrnA [bacterium]|nr:bifunctional oligoribonuclease/PAP phosphatase NrnA [bacterium]